MNLILKYAPALLRLHNDRYDNTDTNLRLDHSSENLAAFIIPIAS